MKIKKEIAILLCFMICCPLSIMANGIYILFENDALFPESSDNNYTHGTEIGYTFFTEKSSISFGVNQLMYTPVKINNEEKPQKFERPWCGTLSLFLKHHQFISENLERSTSLNFGIMGDHSAAEQTQKFVHKLLDCREPKGWKWQMPSEIMLNATIDYYYLILNYNDFIDVKVNFGGDIGTTFINGYLGSEIRLGYNIPKSSFGAQQGISPKAFDKSGFFVYGFVGMGAEGVLHNATISDSFFRNREGWQERELEHLVFLWRGGLVIGHNKFGSISYVFEQRSDDFKEQNDGGMQWGLIKLDFSLSF